MSSVVSAYDELHRDVLINADLWDDTPRIITADLGFEGIIGIPGLTSAERLDLAIAAGAGVNLDYATLVPTPTLRNLTSGGSPVGVIAGGFGTAVTLADALPIVFSWPVLPSSVDPTDIRITLNTGAVVTPDAAALNPNYDLNERHVIVVFGEFGNRMAPGTTGAIHPVSVNIVGDDTPLMLVGPDGPVSAVGLEAISRSPYTAGPLLVGARLTATSPLGDFPPDSLSGAGANDAVSLYGEDAQYRLRLYTSGGFSPDGVSGILPTEFARFFRLSATDAAGQTVTIDSTGVTYDLGVGRLQVIGLAELGAREDGSTVTYGPYYVEDHDNYIDVIIKGDRAAVERLSAVEIPTSAQAGYSDIYTPGGPGRTPVDGTVYTSPAPQQTFPITVSLDSLGTVSYADQTIADYDQADGLPVVFALRRPADGHHFYTSSSIEAANAITLGYVEDGVPFSNEGGSTAVADVHRLYNPDQDIYFYTASDAERDTAVSEGGFEDQGVAFGAYTTEVAGSAAVHRFRSATTGDYIYTPYVAETDLSGYRYEGIAWYSAAFQEVSEESADFGRWNVLEEAHEIIDGGTLIRDPSLPLATYKSGGDSPVPDDVWYAGYDAPTPYIVNTTRNLQFNESMFLASPGEGLGNTEYITTSDGYTWAAMSEAINAMWPFNAADYSGSEIPITNAYAAGNLVTTPDAGVVKVTANFKAQNIKFYANDPDTGAVLDRYFVIDEWGNEYIMHASGQLDQSQVRAAFDAAVLPEGWTKEVRQLSEDLVLSPAVASDDTYHYLVFRDSADNTYHQTGWSGRGSLAAQIEGMPIWGGQTDDTLFGNDGWDNLIHGGGGNDTLLSGRGKDTLWGDDGNDAFRFQAPDRGGDMIMDFQTGMDTIEVVAETFIRQGPGPLAAANFALDKPVDRDDYFVFDTATGTLSFDRDGSGIRPAIALAILNVRTLSASDITIVG